LNDVELKSTKQENESWENELWSLIDNSDGTNCPLQKNCLHKDNPDICLNRNSAYADALHKFLDSDILIPPPFEYFPKVLQCMANTELLMLVEKLAEKQAEKITNKAIPVPMDVFADILAGKTVEIRLVPLKSMHGAVWSLNDAWVIHLNSKDSTARQRFTLFHEVFHILAHCNAEPVFKKSQSQRAGDFNEMLADFFSGMIVLPAEMMRENWQEIKDTGKMAALFDVPETVMYCGLKWMKLM
jgi:Zn-dependent peptidase ImmA (M78 family)